MLGATVDGDACEFRVWAPNPKSVMLRLLRQEGEQDLPMQRLGAEHFTVRTAAEAGDRYFYVVDSSKPVPDPVSRLLPEGVHGPTEIIDPAIFAWTDREWPGLRLNDYIIYELHVGTFTAQGTLDAAVEKLPYLKQLGISVIELMPLAAFPGTHNWGYDGVSFYAVQAGYGGPEGLRRFVNAAHAIGLGVILDVVYNHLGNEGNYLRLFGPYFTDKHHTPWGEAINYDQACCQEVRDYVLQNALYWIREYHLDGLRLDAIQTILDDSPVHIVAEIKQQVAALAAVLGRALCVIAETDQNDAKIVRPPAQGGWGLDALWSDDFHHAVHAFFTGERYGYYQDFGSPEQIAIALREGFVFQGQPSQFWNGKPRGTPAAGLPLPVHVFCLQNHDQVGNRARGERLTALVPRGARFLAAALLLLAPETPLIFMGQEYDEPGPFQFFTDYGDPQLQKAVSEGRRNEFKAFGDPDEPWSDPQDPAAFECSKLNWRLAESENPTLVWYRSLLELRKTLVMEGERTCKADVLDGILRLQIPAQSPCVQVFARLQGNSRVPMPAPGWSRILHNNEDEFVVAVDLRSRDSESWRRKPTADSH